MKFEKSAIYWVWVQIRTILGFYGEVNQGHLRSNVRTFRWSEFILIFQIYKRCDNGKYKLETSWQAHSATIWHLDWAHPHHGIILASCSFDKYLRTWMPPVQKNTDFNKRGHSNHNRDYAQEWEMTGDDCVDRRASVTDVRYCHICHRFLCQLN